MRRCIRSPVTVWALWLINITILLGLVAWIFSDGQFALATEMLKDRIHAFVERGTSAAVYTWYSGRIRILAIITVLAAASFVGIFLGLFFGAKDHRRLRSWFAFTLLLAAWLTLTGSWRELAWRGQTYRLQSRTAGFETIAQKLRADWPNADGQLSGTGQFMAYPIGGPSMLLMLTRPVVPHTTTSFSSIERGTDGTLRFELIGDEPGAWLEWHPPGSVPQSFVGGLQNEYPLERFTPLRDGWYLVRYQRSVSRNPEADLIRGELERAKQ